MKSSAPSGGREFSITGYLSRNLHLLILLFFSFFIVDGVARVFVDFYQKSLMFNLFFTGFIAQGFAFLFLSELEFYYPFGRQAGFGAVEHFCERWFGKSAFNLYFSKSIPLAVLALLALLPIIKGGYLKWASMLLGFLYSHHLFASYSDLTTRMEKESQSQKAISILYLTLFHLFFLCLIFKFLLSDIPFTFSRVFGSVKGQLSAGWLWVKTLLKWK